MTEEDIVALHTEFEILKSIDHPNVVQMYSMYEDAQHYCLVMELMEGGQVRTEHKHGFESNELLFSSLHFGFFN